tara:strand:- start:594 stop:1604 length:1011 start_codon:yes stop_codon:yes gene_type:complete
MNRYLKGRKKITRLSSCLLLVGAFTINTAAALEQPSSFKPDQGKLLATHGISTFDGAGGGGLVPWALITGGGSRDSWGVNTHLTSITLPSYQINSYGFAVGLFDRVELSYADQQLNGTSGPLTGLKINQEVWGAKVKLFGDAVYNQDSWIPQVSAGLLYHNYGGVKSEKTPVLPQSLTGQATDPVPYASHNNGTEYYIAATKLFLAQSLLVNATVRFTKANQLGLLGFGSPGNDSYEPMFETSVAYLLRHDIAIGVEYRMRPNNLENLQGHPLSVSSIDAEEDAWDIFAAWFPTKNVSLAVAYVDLGVILNPGQTALGMPNPKKQHGAYLSMQVGF